MSKKSGSKKKAADKAAVCGLCQNYRPGKGCSGTCKRKDKKRSADEKACGSFKAK